MDKYAHLGYFAIWWWPLVAASQIGKCACRLHLGEKDILIALRVHIDSSGKKVNQFLTIAAFAASDEVWADFETGWAEILDGHSPKATYIHMKEVAIQINGFSWQLGWNLHNAFTLVGKCLVYISRMPKETFRMFYCCIDLEAWRKLESEGYELQDPIEMCNDFCVGAILGWHMEKYPNEVEMDLSPKSPDSAHYFFDRGEDFAASFRKRWNEGKNRFYEMGEVSPWILIDEVSEVDMKKVPGVQAADVLAWSVNRENTGADGMPGKLLLEIMKNVVPSRFVEWDEATMRKVYRKKV